MFDAETLVFETIARHTGVDPAEFSMKTKLRGTRDIRPQELAAILADIQDVLGKPLPDAVAQLQSVGGLVELVDELGTS